MHKRNIISRFFLSFLLVISVVLYTACSNPDEKVPDKSKEVNNDTAQANPYLLTESDLRDDSVFANGSRPASWQDAGVTDPVAMKTFIRKLQVWVRDNYVDSIAPYLVYPMRNPGIPDKAEFKLNYGTYFSDGVKAALAEQRLDQLFRNEQGVMIGQGQLWLRETNKNIQIIAINN